VIKGGTVVTADGQSKADVLVVGETIAAVGPSTSRRPRARA
jgi:dihydroorotase-like cyclic amidohydrolase